MNTIKLRANAGLTISELSYARLGEPAKEAGTPQLTGVSVCPRLEPNHGGRKQACPPKARRAGLFSD